MTPAPRHPAAGGAPAQQSRSRRDHEPSLASKATSASPTAELEAAPRPAACSPRIAGLESQRRLRCRGRLSRRPSSISPIARRNSARGATANRHRAAQLHLGALLRHRIGPACLAHAAQAERLAPTTRKANESATAARLRRGARRGGGVVVEDQRPGRVGLDDVVHALLVLLREAQQQVVEAALSIELMPRRGIREAQHVERPVFGRPGMVKSMNGRPMRSGQKRHA